MPYRLPVLLTVLLQICFHAVSLAQQDSYKISGQVIDFDTRQPIKNVTVMVRKSTNGTITDDSGRFTISVRQPAITLVFSFVGYSSNSKELSLPDYSKALNIELKKKANEMLDEVVVNAYKDAGKVKTTEMNIVKINPESIKRAPLLFGEADIIRALTLQPGVTNAGEGAGGYNVRGGNADQNLVLIDGAPVFNTSHLLGFYTSVTPDAVQDVILYKGGMPAAYGGRLSSLLNMKIKAGNNTRMQFNGGIGPMSARFFLNGPLIKNKLTVSGGLRVAYPDPILNQLKDNFGASRAFFYDGILKAEWTINSKNRLSITGYRSYDRFKFDTLNSYSWETNLLTLNYTAEFNDKFSFRLNGNVSQFNSSIFNLEKYYEFELTSSISHKQVKPVFTFRPNNKHSIEWGADYILYDITPGNRRPDSDSSSVNAITIQKEQGREMAAFISDQIDFTDRISLQVGVRYASYDYRGPKTVYLYEADKPLSRETITDSVIYGSNKNIQQYGGLEPRVALKIGLSDELTVKLSYNRGQQFMHLISNTTAISPVDFWKLSDQYVKRQLGDQYAAGIFRSFKNNQYEMSVELYYKTTKNMVQYKDGALLLQNPYIETALLNQRGRAYGIEFSAVKNFGKVTGQVNYTYSKAEGQIQTRFPEELVNGGNYYPSEIDRPHNLSIVTKIKMGRGWSFSSNFIFTSGRPATYPDGNYVLNGTIVTNYSKRNVDRLPAYHRLDAGFTWVSKRYAEQKRYSLWNFSFYNLYMHKNAYSIYFKREGTRLYAYRLSVVGGLIPSVTWNYNF